MTDSRPTGSFVLDCAVHTFHNGIETAMRDQSSEQSIAKTILVVDNEVRSRNNIARFLREEGYGVEEADDGVSALELLDRKSFDLLICDVVMPRVGAFDVLNRIKSRALPTAIILITGHPYLVEEKGLGDLPCFEKPFNLYDLLHKIREVLG